MVETVVGAALLAMVSISVYQAYASVIMLTAGSADKVTATLIANEQIEILRNLPYDQVGTQGGIPSGLIEQATTTIRDGHQFAIVTVIRNMDDPFDGTFPTDISAADYKLASVSVTCNDCLRETSVELTTSIAPKGLEGVSNNGALYISVTDALGMPVVGASVNVVNSTHAINLSDTTDINGLLKIYDVPPASLAYSVTVTKDDYSTDSTMEPSVDNPSPAKRDLTVAAGQATNGPFSIDRTASLTITSVTTSCNVVADYNFDMHGNKTIGSNNGAPVYKYTGSLVTSASGILNIDSLEWDYYTLISTDSDYDLAGALPASPLNLTPGQAVDAKLVVKQSNPASLMVSVKDQATRLPVSGATVSINTDSGTDELITGIGSLSQTNWSGGAGQVAYTDESKFYDSDGNIDIGTTGQLTLLSQGSVYPAGGWLISSTFDMQASGSLYKLTWLPQDQPAETGVGAVKFQIASNDDNSTWNFIGPDGTGATYYTATENSIGAEHSDNRYFRYKIYLSTEDAGVTPIITDVTLQFTTGCTPSSEVLFQGLPIGQASISVTAPGYGQVDQSGLEIADDWQYYEVYLSVQ